MYRSVGLLGVAVAALVTGVSGDDIKPSREQPKVVRDSVKGSIHHGSGGLLCMAVKRVARAIIAKR